MPDTVEFARDFDRCYRAVSSRDRRFDGRFVTAVTSTGIYCRPSCPAQTPKPANVRFYAVPAAAQAAGFRACKRCRPQAAPGTRDWDVRADLAGRAMRLIGDGVVDTTGVSGLAQRLSVSERHLHRILVDEIGAGPLALARTRRAQTARLLIESTGMSLSDVAFTAGYSSIRQFNESIQAAFGCTPGALRTATRSTLPATGAITLRLALIEPFSPGALLDWFAGRAVDGIDEVEDGTYRRTIRLPHSRGLIELTPATDHVALRVHVDRLTDLAIAVGRARALADLDADPAAVAATLGSDPLLRRPVEESPGLRVPGTLDGFELACRAVLGQQVSVAGARTTTGRLVRALGEPLTQQGIPGDWMLFPQPATVAASELDGLGLTTARRRTLRALGAAVADGSIHLDPGADRAETTAALLALPGIGPWTAGYIAMRALGDPDAFPTGDLGLLRAAAALGGPTDAAGLVARAERWRPWRSYAAQYLWSHH
jgi:AraC family transcriptional regulator, regulatory protein of adaptative response / DNA-3-methyladenine glycosylase II